MFRARLLAAFAVVTGLAASASAAHAAAPIRLISPQADTLLAGTIHLRAAAPGARSVIFRARWTDADGVSRIHRVGIDRHGADGWTATWDARAVAAQAGVTVSARALARGGRTIATTAERAFAAGDGGAVSASSGAGTPVAARPASLPPVVGTYKVFGTCAASRTCTLSVRAAPSATAAKVGTLEEGAGVGVRCQATGSTVTTSAGSSSTWDRLGDGQWVSDLYLATPKDAGRIPRCATASAPAPSGRTKS